MGMDASADPTLAPGELHVKPRLGTMVPPQDSHPTISITDLDLNAAWNVLEIS